MPAEKEKRQTPVNDNNNLICARRVKRAERGKVLGASWEVEAYSRLTKGCLSKRKVLSLSQRSRGCQPTEAKLAPGSTREEPND